MEDSGGRTVCQFNVQGVTQQGRVSSESLQSDGPVGPLLGANITCRGSILNLIGGPLLDEFSSAFVGVQYTKAVELPGATMVIQDGNLAIEDSFFSGLSFFGQGALVLSNSNVTFINATFTANNNSAAGAIYANDTSSITVLDSTFLGNGGGQGGAIAMWNSSLLVNGTAFQGNVGRSAGGAIAANNASAITIITSTFTSNMAENGGAIFIEECGKAVVNDNTFTRNKATRSGGGIFQSKCSGNMDTNYFRLNSALNGGSVWQNNCKKIVHSGSRFDNNTSERGSAGIEMNQITSIDIVSCTFSTGKSAKGSGLYLQGVQGNVRECLFESNVADFGGAIFRGSTTGDIIGSVFSSNKATKIGGAIYDSHAKGDITTSTFQGNSAPKGKAIFRTESSGDVLDNKKLDEDTQVTIDNPSST
ncbi:hypothetical protein WJX75_008926 [Coccomyxa subellipsoidea]|uniref:Right handed beta helix domain-containing protein n=1 Tax=Coccomyxa subellipsoidea TaxID=248742 RepID=A0ABR2Z4A6_9CHLO